MTDAPASPAHQAVRPPPKPRKPQRVEFKGKPIGHESGRAQHSLRSHEKPK
jgi:hypothetical protein